MAEDPGPLRTIPRVEEATVLVVEDDPDLRDLYSEWVSDRYRAETAPTGRSALERLDPSVDVVVLDRGLPDLDGTEVLRRVRDRDIEAMVAMVTGMEPAGDVATLPFDDYVRKPLTREDFLETIDSLLHRYRYTAAVRTCFELATKLSMLESSDRTASVDREPESDLRSRLDHALETADDSIQAVIETSGFRGPILDMNR